MSARPVIIGRLYHVKGHGLDMDVIAENGAHALAIAAESLPWAN